MAKILLKKYWLISLLLFGACAQAGIVMNATRLVFTDKTLRKDIRLVNTNDYPILVQTWADDGEVIANPSNSKAPVMVFPAMFRLQNKESKNLKVMYSTSNLPQDRESLFWLNVLELPPTPTQSDKEAFSITLGVRTQIKLIYRPSALEAQTQAASRQLRFTLKTEQGKPSLVLENPSPYFITLSWIGLDKEERPLIPEGAFLAPFSQESIPLEGSVLPVAEDKLLFTRINDQGDLTRHNFVLGTK